MKVIGIASTAILLLSLGIATPAFAQHEQQGEKRDDPKEQQGKRKKSKPRQKAPEQQRQSDQDHRQPQRAEPQRPQEQNRQPVYDQRQRGNDHRRHQEPQRTRGSMWQQHRARSWKTDHRTWRQRGGYRGYRVADDRFRRYFGPEHGFRIHGLPFLVVSGHPRFQYSGYWVSLVDPWPESWANDWYETDDVYVTYVDNGYYLSNRRHPGVDIAIQISM